MTPFAGPDGALSGPAKHRSGAADRRYFVGHWGAARPNLQPAGGRLLWAAPSRLWIVGDWERELHLTRYREHRLAVFGSCLATGEELATVLARVVRDDVPEELAGLPGSFGAVLASAGRVRLVTDLAGLHPVFHASTGDGQWFASSPLPLAALCHGSPGLDAVNADQLAARLFCPELSGVLDGESVFRGVRRAGGRQVLTVDRTGAAVTAIPAGERCSRAEGADALRNALVCAAERRMRRAAHPTADLSGGLDSSTLAVLASRAGAHPLAITYADHVAGNEDDVRCARRVAAQRPGLRHVVVRGDAGCLPFHDLAGAPMTDEPSLDLLIAARTRRRLQPAIQEGSDLHLGGDGGDVVLGPDLTYLADLARAGDRRRLRREATAWARLRQRPAREMVRAAVRLGRTSWPATLRRMADDLRQPAGPMPGASELERRLCWARLSAVAGWGTTGSRRTFAARLHAGCGGAAFDLGLGDSALTEWLALWGHGSLTREYGQVTRALGVVTHAPFLDNQVVRACLAVPPEARISPARPKPLLEAAVGDLMPAGLLRRRTKGDYTACEYHGLRANAARLRELLRGPVLADIGVLAPAGPRTALDAALAGHRAPLAGLGAVIATEVWLRRLGELSRRYWTPVPRGVVEVAR